MSRRTHVRFWVVVGAVLCCVGGVATASRSRGAQTDEDRASASGDRNGATRAGRVKALTAQVIRLQGELEKAPPALATGIAERERQLLRERRLELKALVEEDPAGALASSLDTDIRRRMASAIPMAQEDLETVGRFQGPAEVLVADDFDAGKSETMVTIELDGKPVQVHFAGTLPEGLASGTYLAVEGMLVDDRIAASSGEVLPAIEVAPPCSTTGDQPIAVLLVSFPNHPLPASITPEFVRNFFFGDDGGVSLDGYWREASYGLTSASGDVFGPYNLSQDYTCDQYGSMKYAAMLAADADVDFRNYNRIFIVFPRLDTCSFAGLGELSCNTNSTPGDGSFSASTTWLWATPIHNNRDWGVFVAAHEGGHNLGLHHSFWRSYGSEPLSWPGAPSTNIEYGDPFSAMGRPYYTHYAAPHKLRLGWLNPAVHVQTVTQSGTYSLPPYEQPAAGTQVLRVQRGTESEWLWIESRTGQSLYECSPGGPLSCDGALVHYEVGNFQTFLIDFTRNTPSNVNDAPIPTGTTYFDRYTGLSLTPTHGAGTLDITATYGARTCHKPPLVEVTPAGQTVSNGGAVSFTVTVTNVDEPTCPTGTYQLGSLPGGWGGRFTPTSLTLSPGATGSASLAMTVPRSTEAGSHTVTANATWTSVTGSGTQTVNVTSDCVLGDPIVRVLPDTKTVAVNEPAYFTIEVDSTDTAGCGAHRFAIASALPSGWSGSISPSLLNLSGNGPVGFAQLTKWIPAGTTIGSTHLVEATVTSQPGTPPAVPRTGSDTAQLTVAEACTHEGPTVTSTPTAAIGAAGGDVNFTGHVRNNDSSTCNPVTYTVEVTGPSGWTVFPVSDCIPPCPPTVTIPAGQSADVWFGATVPFGTGPGAYPLSLSAIGNGIGTAYVTVGVEPVCLPQNPTVVLTPASAPANAGQPASFTATITNNDLGSTCGNVSFALSATVPAGWSSSVAPSVSVAPGASVQVPFYATSPVGAASGSYGVSLTAANGGYAGTGGAAVQVSAVCIQGSGPVVTLTPDASTVSAGQTARFGVTLVDNDQGAACAGYDVTLETSQPAGFGHSIVPSALFVPPGGTVNATFDVTPGAANAGGTYTVTVTAVRGFTIGDDSTGSAIVRVQPYTTLEAGYGHSIAAHPDGTVWAWGLNASGQLGDSTLTNRNGPVRSGSITSVPEVGAGVFHSVALRSDGTVWAWGGNGEGQLGNGTTTARSFPGQVPGLPGIVAIAAGFSHTLALASDGTVWAWGDNWGGQIGDGTTTDRLTPFQVPGLTGVAAVGAGAYHSLALKSDGTVWTWGRNAEGELGDGTHADRFTPGPVPGLAGVTRVSCGAYFNVVVLADGTMKGWGHNFFGQLGDGTTQERTTPVSVSVLTGVTRIAAGSAFTLAVRSDGSIWSFGQNVAGQLGDGTTTHRSTPQQIAGLTGIVAVAAGEDHSLARSSAGVVYGWGKNLYGQVGTAPDPRTTPIIVYDQTQPAPLGLISPVGGETWEPGSGQIASWTGAGPISVSLSLDGGATYTLLVPSTSLQDVPITVPPDWSTALGRLRIDRVGTPPSSAQTGAYLRIHALQRYPWLTTTVDASPATTGEFASIAIDPWGRTGIAYTDRTNGDLRFALRTGAGWTIETVDAVGGTGWYTSLAFGADGSPRISYMDGTRTYLRYASRSGGTWTLEDVANTNCALPTSLAFDTADRPFIAFQNCASTEVKLWARSGTWQPIITLSGASPSLAMHGDLPRISYFQHAYNPTQLNYVAASGTLGSFDWTGDVVPGGDGANWNSLVLDPQGNPRISFYAANTRSLRMAKKNAGVWSVDVVDAGAGDVGNWSSIALDTASRPRISYLANGLVKLAEWTGSAWQLDAVDVSGVTPAATALAVDGGDNNRVAYFDAANGDLRYAISQPDATPPAPPALALTPGRSTIVASWTSTGDDGSSGSAAIHDLRMSLAPIDESSFSQATAVPLGPPGPAGTPQCVDFQQLPRCTTHYFALRVVDDAGNSSFVTGQVTTKCSGSIEVLCS